METNTDDTKPKIAVIADDLTGANDTGVQFAKQGLTTIVLMEVKAPCQGIDADVVVLDSQSRGLTPAEAYRRVARAAELCRDGAFQVVFKKIDSTLRGHIGREIDAIMDTCGQELALVVPAFPKNGRVTAGGYLLLQGTPLEATEIARDPTSPITESHIPTLLSEQTVRQVGHVGIKTIIAGHDAILEAMRQMITAGDQVIVCDAWEDDHLRTLALAAVSLDRPLLWVGSAGLAEHLPGVLGLASTPLSRPPLPSMEPRAKGNPVLVLAGSVSSVTRAQVRVLKRRSHTEVIVVDPCVLLEQDSGVDEMRRCFDAALTAGRAGKDVVLACASSDVALAATRESAARLRLSMPQTAERIAAAMGELCLLMAINIDLRGLVLTGGDIAVSSCNRLSATGFSVITEVAPGIPLGRLKGGRCDGLMVVTKAGAFGAEDALRQAVDCLKQYRGE